VANDYSDVFDQIYSLAKANSDILEAFVKRFKEIVSSFRRLSLEEL